MTALPQRVTALTEQQRVGACLLLGFAALTFVEDRKNDVWWYAWCVEHSSRARGFEAAVWWAIRVSDEPGVRDDDAESFLAYVTHVWGNHLRSGSRQ